MTHVTMPGSSKLSTYEKQQVDAIEAWKNEPPNAVARALSVFAAPAKWLIQRVVPEDAIRGALEGASWLAEQTIDSADLCREGGVSTVFELRHGSLERSDEMAESVHKWAVGIAVTQGAATGVLGLAGMVVDVPFIVTLAVRTIRKIGFCYGYEGTEEWEREFALGVLSASGANSVSEKLEALATLKAVETMLLRQTWKSLGEKAVASTFSKEAGVVAIRNLAKQLGINITKRKALQIIPAVGAGIGATMNGMFIHDVSRAARRSFQERWLTENSKLITAEVM
jgi:hypothetical protein